MLMTRYFAVSQSPYMSSGLYGRGMPMGMSAFGMTMPQMSMDQGKGKGKQIDFDAAFAQLHASLADQTEGARITEVTDETVDELAGELEGTTLDKGKDKAAEQENPYMGTDFEKYAHTHDTIEWDIELFAESGSSCRTRSCPRRNKTWRSGRRSSTS